MDNEWQMDVDLIEVNELKQPRAFFVQFSTHQAIHSLVTDSFNISNFDAVW